MTLVTDELVDVLDDADGHHLDLFLDGPATVVTDWRVEFDSSAHRRPPLATVDQ